MSDVVERYARHVNPELVKLLGVFGYGRVFTRAEDVWLWDEHGRRYLDMLAAFGAASVGHHHPRIRGAAQRFFDAAPVNLNHLGPSAPQADLAEALCTRTGFEIALFSSSGGEAVEAAMKVARAATRRAGFLSCDNGFHGTNFGSLSIAGPARWRDPFEPLLPGCDRVPFGDLRAARRSLATRNYAAFVIEPILGEGGVVVPPEGYLAGVADACRETGTIFVLDEVQTGFGRTGRWFEFEASVKPDILVLGKALGAGLVPVSATLLQRDLHQRAYGGMEKFDLHSSTYGGNAFGCAIALETLAILDQERLVANSAERGQQLIDGLRSKLSGHPFVRSIRGRGLLVGIELGPTDSGVLNRLAPWLVRGVSKNVFGQWAALRLLEAGIVCQPASQQWDVLRIEPPLTIRAGEIDMMVTTLADILGAYDGLPALLKDVTVRLAAQGRSGWAFP